MAGGPPAFGDFFHPGQPATWIDITEAHLATLESPCFTAILTPWHPCIERGQPKMASSGESQPDAVADRVLKRVEIRKVKHVPAAVP